MHQINKREDLSLIFKEVLTWVNKGRHQHDNITTAQLHSSKPELRFCASSNPACGISRTMDPAGQQMLFISQPYHKKNSSSPNITVAKNSINQELVAIIN